MSGFTWVRMSGFIWLRMSGFIWLRMSGFIWLRISQLYDYECRDSYDYECRSYMTTNFEVVWLRMSKETTNVWPKLSNVPFVPYNIEIPVQVPWIFPMSRVSQITWFVRISRPPRHPRDVRMSLFFPKSWNPIVGADLTWPKMTKSFPNMTWESTDWSRRLERYA